MLVPCTYNKLALKSKKCFQCDKPMIQTSSDLQKTFPYTFSSFLINFIPKIYFLACRFYDDKMGDAFLEVINTIENDMTLHILPYEKEGLVTNVTAQIKPIEEVIELTTKESVRDEVLVIDDAQAFQSLPKQEKSKIIRCKKNCAIIQLVFSIPSPSDSIKVIY